MESKLPRRVKLAVMIASFTLIPGYVLSQRGTYAVPFVQTPELKNPLQPNETNLAFGLDHFDAHCATCHGASGKADTGKGRRMRAADLTSDEVQSRSDAELFSIISRGVAGTAMPAFEKTHSSTAISQIVLFLRKLPTLTEAERAKLRRAMPQEAAHNHATQQPDVEARPNPKADAKHDHQTQTPAGPVPPSPPANPSEAQHDHVHPTQPPAQNAGEIKRDGPAHDMSKMGKESEGRDPAAAHTDHDMNAMMSTITGGPFRSMSAIGSGTSLMPASAPGYMWHWMKRDWMIMAHGDLKAGFNHQGGPRGVNKAESQNWFMLMAERQVGPGRLMLRGMVSAEPWTTPRRGFPELFQTGETFERRPIIDAQHPHDLFMELAAAYNIQLSEHVALNFYGGPVAEPALGPVAFMHRASAAENPAAPLGHHWHDSTHISHGVITAGVTAWRFRIESSLFHGAEPDENRKDIEMGKLDSWSGRIWFTPTPDWTMQFSYGRLVHPEIIIPGNLQRLTASISHNHSWDSGNWATSLIWGRNHETHGNSNAYLLESTANFLDRNYLYTRMELVDKPGLLEENIFGRPGLDEFHSINDGFELGQHFSQQFRVGAFTFGGVRDIVASSRLRVGIGADVTFYHVPNGLEPVYGSSPTSFHLFLRVRPGKVKH